MESNGRIWRASVQPTATNLPVPGSSKPEQAQNLYTKTSLLADSSITNLNREILSASQAYNNTPRPFRRQDHEAATSTIGATYTISPVAKSESPQVKSIQQSLDPTRASATKATQVGRIVRQEENMAPKLIHNQFNSPIDLYSMNNIRKTIEAHTELIAPGIKGINFMKPEMPVNKESEVYKLVKEEEAQRNRQKAPLLSPISSQPVANQTPSVQDRSVVASAGHCDIQHQHHQQEANRSHNRLQSNVQSCKIASQTGQSSSGEGQRSDALQRQVDNQLRPTCCECGQFISGPFAKIQDRFVHPLCFNCTTCGTSLKNTGYFTINEKLYCEIHAKQVARVMQIKFDFDGKQDQRLNQSPAILLQPPQEESVPSLSSKQTCSNNSDSVTISTMFANRADSEIRQDLRPTRWSWGPSSSRADETTSDSNLPNRMLTACSNLQLHQSSSRCSPSPNLQTAQQQTMSTADKRRDLFQEKGSLVGSKASICVHCNAKIQGPYILAGKAIWCKLCSQNTFQCSSCYRSLLDTGFIEDSSHKYYCEQCFEVYYAPICSKCNLRIKGDCLNALNKQWHPSCFVCGHCHRPFGNSSFYLEDNEPYCERDWNVLYTTKCFACSNPIEAGDRWIEALNRNYHSNCFKCTSCHANLEGSTFYCKGGKPYCRSHAR